MKTGWFYLLVIATVAIPFALFEVWGMAHYRVGWGDPLPPDTAWGKPLFKEIPFNLADPRLLTRYHFVMFFVVVPVLLVASIVLLKRWAEHPPATGLAWALFVIACVLGVMELEDFLFFAFSSVLQTPYPDALLRFFRGEANWHSRWINFGLFKLPDFYLWFPPIIALLLWSESTMGRGKH
jgi:hypothetical protein